MLLERYLKVSSIYEKENLNEDEGEKSYNTFRYLYNFLQVMDDVEELRYVLAYFAKSNGFVSTKEFTFNEEKQIAEDDQFLKDLPEADSKTYISKPIYFYRAGREDSLTQRAKRGEFRPRIKTQVVIFCANMQKIGGIETWMYYFCKNMYKLYDIIVVFSDNMDGKQIERLYPIVQVLKLTDKYIECDNIFTYRRIIK